MGSGLREGPELIIECGVCACVRVYVHEHFWVKGLAAQSLHVPAGLGSSLRQTGVIWVHRREQWQLREPSV